MVGIDAIRENLSRVQEEMECTARRAGVPIPLLVAVTKSAESEDVLALCSLGITDIAENRTSLFNDRYALFEDKSRPRMHLIGSLQTNKVKEVIGKTALVQSLDRPSLAKEINRLSEKLSIKTEVLLEVNSGREESKGGVMPEGVIALAEEICGYSHLILRGVMTMGPLGVPSATTRACFRETALLCRTLSERGYITGEPILSMGMSESYPIAIEEGATMIRVGRTLFAPKNN